MIIGKRVCLTVDSRFFFISQVDPEYTDKCVFVRLNRSKTDSFRQVNIGSSL
jgi:hypothetical protein